MINIFVISPRILSSDGFGGTGLGIALAAQELGCDYQDISMQSVAPVLNLHICKLWVTDEQRQAVVNDPRFYVIDLSAAASGDFSGVVSWLKSRDVSRLEFDSEISGFNTIIPELDAALSIVSESLV